MIFAGICIKQACSLIFFYFTRVQRLCFGLWILPTLRLPIYLVTKCNTMWVTAAYVYLSWIVQHRVFCIDPNHLFVSTAQTNILEFYPWVHQLLSISYSMLVGLAHFVRLAKLVLTWVTNTNERSELEDPTVTFRSTVREHHGFLVSYIEIWTSVSGLDEKMDARNKRACRWKHFKLVIYEGITQMCPLAEWVINRMNTGFKAMALSPAPVCLHVCVLVSLLSLFSFV